MFEDTTDNFNNTTIQSKSRDKGKSRVQTLLPVCIKHILDSPEDEFKMFGTPGNILTIVGVLKGMNITSTKATFEIEDHSGTIDAVLWLESQYENHTSLPDVKEGCYVRVMGSFRVTKDVKTLLILKMHNVEDPNEVTTHLLECLHVRYALEKGATEPVEKTGDLSSCFTPLQDQILKILKADTNDHGMHIDSIIQSIPNGNAAKIREAIEELQTEGHMYSTIDKNHVQTTTKNY